MGWHNHVNDTSWNKATCKKCGKVFEWDESEMPYEGCKDKEYVNCPYCGHNYTSFMTNGCVYTRKIDTN